MNVEFISHILVNLEFWSYLIISGACIVLGALLLILLILWAIYYVVNAILVKCQLMPFLFEFAEWKREQNNKNIDWSQHD